MSAEKPEPGDVWSILGERCVIGQGRTVYREFDHRVDFRHLHDVDPNARFAGFNVFHLLDGDLSAWAAAGEAANRPLSGKSFAPWTPLGVAVLNAFQAEPNCHPFTCGTEGCRESLVAEPDGWRCPACDYRQGWCHNFMLDPAMIQAAREARELVGEKSDVLSPWAAALRFAPEVVLVEVGDGKGKREVVGARTDWTSRPR